MLVCGKVKAKAVTASENWGQKLSFLPFFEQQRIFFEQQGIIDAMDVKKGEKDNF